MKFIGLPRTAKRTRMSFTGIIGAVLTVAFVAVCTVGAISAITSRKTSLTENDNMVSDSEEIPIIATSSYVDQVYIPDIPDTPTIIPETTSINMEFNAAVISDTANSTNPELAGSSADSTTSDTQAVMAFKAGVTENSTSGTYYAFDELNIRSGPGKDYSVVGSLSKGQSITIVASTDNGWKKISDQQYVSAELLSSQPPATTTTSTTAATTSDNPEETAHIGTYYVASDNMNVRSGPGTNFSIVKELKKGSGIDVVAKTTNGWYRTVVGTYVKADLCSSTKPEVPSAQTTPQTQPAPQQPAPTSPQETTAGNYLGSFRIVYYGPQSRPDGTYSVTTASGTTCQTGRTIAVDPSVIPLGTRIRINGLEIAGNGGYFTAEDTGSGVKGNMIDIFVSSEEEASRLNNGAYFDVYLAN